MTRKLSLHHSRPFNVVDFGTVCDFLLVNNIPCLTPCLSYRRVWIKLLLLTGVPLFNALIQGESLYS